LENLSRVEVSHEAAGLLSLRLPLAYSRQAEIMPVHPGWEKILEVKDLIRHEIPKWIVILARVATLYLAVTVLPKLFTIISIGVGRYF